MELTRVVLYILSILLAGWNVLYIISFKRNSLCLPERIFISYGLGMAFISLEMLVFYILKIDFSMFNIFAPWILISVLNVIVYFSCAHKTVLVQGVLTKDKKGGGLKISLIFGIAFEIFYSIFRALIKPIEAYDAVSIYAIKSKIFYLAKSIPSDYFINIAKHFPHPDYPLNIPLNETFFYIFFGSLNDQIVKIIFPLYFIGILGLVYFAIRRFSSRTYALLFTFVLASIPQFSTHSTNAYLDLPLSYYCFAGSLFLLKWFEDRRNNQLLLISALMVALAAWTKNEGLMYCIVNAFLITIFFAFNYRSITKKDLFNLFAYLGIIVLVLFPWIWVKKSFNISNDEISLANINPSYLTKQLYKIKPILYEFQKEFFGPKKWNIFWPAAFFILVFNYKRALRGINKYIAISLLLTISGYVLFYLVSYVPAAFFVSKTWSRFLLHFLPLVIYWLALTLKEDINL